MESIAGWLRAKPAERATSPEIDSWEIVGAYAKALEHAPHDTVVRDVRRLPYPKSVIKQALRTAMNDFASNEPLKAAYGAAIGSPPSMESLKVGYMALSRWQENVGEIDLGFDLALAMSGDEGLKEANRRQELGRDLREAAKAEERALLVELDKMFPAAQDEEAQAAASEQSDEYQEALRRARLKADKERKAAEEQRAFQASMREWSERLVPAIREATDQSVQRYQADLVGISELVVLNEPLSIEPSYDHGISVYFVPEGAESFDEVRARYAKGGTKWEDWVTSAATLQIQFSRASTRLRIRILGDVVHIDGEVLQQTEQEGENYSWERGRNPRQMRMPHLKVPADSFDTGVIEKALRDWLTVILNDKVSLTPRHRLT